MKIAPSPNPNKLINSVYRLVDIILKPGPNYILCCESSSRTDDVCPSILTKKVKGELKVGNSYALTMIQLYFKYTSSVLQICFKYVLRVIQVSTKYSPNMLEIFYI